jgi:hypothetical protein
MRLAAAKAEETIRIVLEGEHRRSVPARVRGTFLPWRGARLHRPGRAELCAAAQAGPRACDRRAGDALLLSELPKRIPPEEPVDMVTAEGTHDARAVAPRARAAKPPPSLRSAAGTDTGRKPRLARRRETRRIYRRLGRTIWKRCSGYHQRCRLAAAVTQMTRASALTAGAERVGMAEFHPAFGDHDATAMFDLTSHSAIEPDRSRPEIVRAHGASRKVADAPRTSAKAGPTRKASLRLDPCRCSGNTPQQRDRSGKQEA